MVTLQEIRVLLQRVDYPATREEVLAAAERRGAPAAVTQRLRALPEHRYGSVDAVMDALRGRA